ncbi:DHA2 family efflux MFS transporter permease subunit [Streptomyces sp. NPDC053048]|uniref:DHA2 family efflux MFS transporter permease subunit n=1 Tax=Streptomyces sp. NPDC053048 TaxID=3365694 RepID=UPI0037D7F40F
MTTTTTGPAAGPPLAARPLIALSLGYFLVMLDVTVVTVAVPDIGDALGAGPAALQWIVDGYSTVFAGLLLLGGGLGDRLGHRRTFLWGLAVFTLASAGCGLAGSAAVLVAGRLAQGAGAALLVPASLALLRVTYPDPAVRARAVAVWGAVASTAFGAGPVVGGLLVAGPGWRTAFWLNVPVGALAVLLTVRHVPAPAGRARSGGRTDPAGQVLCVVGLVAVAGALNEAGARGWTSPPVLASAVLGAVALVVFVAVERRLERAVVLRPGGRRPLLPPSLFGRRAFSVTAAVGLLISFGYYGMLFLATLYFRQELGYDALRTGLALLPSVVTGLVAAPLFGRVAARTGPYVPLGAGLFLGGAGFLGWLVAGPGTPYAALLFALVATGLGQTTAALAATAAVVQAVPAEGVGVAAGVFNVARQVGSAVGVGLFGTLAAGDVAGGVRVSAVLAAGAFLGGGVLVVLARREKTIRVTAADPRATADRHPGVTPTDEMCEASSAPAPAGPLPPPRET